MIHHMCISSRPDDLLRLVSRSRDYIYILANREGPTIPRFRNIQEPMPTFLNTNDD